MSAREEGGLLQKGRMLLELRQVKYAKASTVFALSLEEKERLVAKYWEVTRMLRGF